MATPLVPIECSTQPLGMSFHPQKDYLVAAALVDGTLEVHDFTKIAQQTRQTRGTAKSTKITSCDDDDFGDNDEEEEDTIVSSIPVHTTGSAVPRLKKTSPGDGFALPTVNRQPSCRALLFSSGDTSGGLFTAGNNGDICSLDLEVACSTTAAVIEEGDSTDNSIAGIQWRIGGAHPHGINALHELPPTSPAGPLLVSGDDEGMIRLWDTRLCTASSSSSWSFQRQHPFDNLMTGSAPQGCVATYRQNTDYISGFDTPRDGTTLLATSGDCTLSAFDVRRSALAKNNSVRRGKDSSASFSSSSSSAAVGIARQSDDQEDELLSVVTLKNGKKVVCGTQKGVLAVWSWGTWGDVSDRFPGHPASIDALLKVDEDTVLTGSSDGLIRVVQIHPDRMLGVLGEHGGFPVEQLHFSLGRKYVGSVSHDELIRLWDASLLDGDDGDDDDDDDVDIGMEGGEEARERMDVVHPVRASDGLMASSASAARGAALEHDSDDEWEDVDDMDDDSDSDSERENHGTKRGGRGRGFKTENEKFFEDL